MSPVWPPRRHAEEAYGWFSQICADDTGSTPLVYETTDGDEVLAFGVCSSPDLTTIMWKDKVCVGLVNTRTAKRSSMRGYMACSRWVWLNRAVVSTPRKRRPLLSIVQLCAAASLAHTAISTRPQRGESGVGRSHDITGQAVR